MILLPKSERGLPCPCGCRISRVIWTRRRKESIRRNRQCAVCKARFVTVEAVEMPPAKK